MSLLAQFCRYAAKVYGLPHHLRAVRDTRSFPVIPTAGVNACLFLGALLRLPSFLQIGRDSGRSGWRRWLGVRDPVQDDLLRYVAARYRLEDWRGVLVGTNQVLKRNKAFEPAKIQGLLVVALDANELFSSRSRCCEACCQRQITVRSAEGPLGEVAEYYHRLVFAQIQGPKFSVLLDLEPVAPGEDECAAALRLLGRMRRLYGPRFFDVITVDAWYTKASFVRAVRRLGWGLISVLKQERFTAYQEASVLAAAQPPLRLESNGRRIALRQVRHLTLSEEEDQPVRIVLADEAWVDTEWIGGRKVRTPRHTHWRWIASPELDPYSPQTIWRAGHQRWGIENHAFNELTQHYHLTHCPHHHPVAIVAWVLILVLAFNLFEVFVRLHSKLWQQGTTSLQDLARTLDRALEHPEQLQPLWSG